MKVTIANIAALADIVIEKKSTITPDTKSVTLTEEAVILVDLQKDFFSGKVGATDSLIINGKFITDIDVWEYAVEGEVKSIIRRGLANLIMDGDDFNNRLNFLLNDLFSNKFGAIGAINCNIHNVPGTEINYVEMVEAGEVIYRRYIADSDKTTFNVKVFLRKVIFDQILKGNIDVEI